MADFSSSELYVYDSANDGMFFRFSVSPTSHDLDPYWFFMKYDDFGNLVPNNDYGITVKDFDNENNEDLNTQKNPALYEVRIAAVKTPIIVSGWGYDIAGVAAPAFGENRYFDPYTPIDRSRWKTGPLDIRWDDERKVWTAGAEVIEGILEKDIEGTDDPQKPTNGIGIIYRGEGWKYGDKYSYAPNPNPLTAIRPNPLGGDPNVNAGDGSQRQEKVKLINRSKASFSKDDYFLAVKINYEWRIIGGGSTEKAKTGSILLILGDYYEYRKNKNCVSFDPCMKEDENGNKIPCAPSYAWASYDICGCKYKKVTDIKGYGEWAYHVGYLNAPKGWAAAFYGGSLKQDDTGGSCKGVRFLPSGGGLPSDCTCPEWFKKLKCIKAEVVYISKPDCTQNCPCGDGDITTDTYWTPMEDYWGKTINYNMDNQFSQCDFATDIASQYSLTLLWKSVFDGEECFFGPEEFDPCDPCDGLVNPTLSLNGTKANTNGGNIAGGWPIDRKKLKTFAENCTKGVSDQIVLTSFTPVTFDVKCPNPVKSVTLRCCS